MKHRRWIAVLLTAVLLGTALCGTAYAEPGRLPDVSRDMGDPGFWTGGDPAADMLLADAGEIAALNQSILDTPECCMTDLRAAEGSFNAQTFYRNLWASVFQDAGSMMKSRYYGAEDNLIGGEDLMEILSNIDGRGASEDEALRYGICVRRTDMRWLPGDAFATDEKGDLNYNWFQLYGVHVNEPLLIKAVSADGAYYCCVADCCSGWVPAEDVAICADRDEWLEAWDIPDEEAVVVTEGKIFLETSNVSPAASGVLLTLGTVLRRVDEKDYDAKLTGRANVYNYPVWLPVRQADGSYAKTIALIAQNYSVSEGYLPLTENNILKVAYTMLGNIYGWGGMLDSADCSSYARDVYRCFGLNLPRNTTWQSAMPVRSFSVSEMDSAEKEALLGELPAGTLLYMSGHEMLYLGQADGRSYVISAVSSIFDSEAGKIQRIRSVVINALDKTVRGSGKSWLESLETVIVPWQQPEPLPEDDFVYGPQPETPEENDLVYDFPYGMPGDDDFTYGWPQGKPGDGGFAYGWPQGKPDDGGFAYGWPQGKPGDDGFAYGWPQGKPGDGGFAYGWPQGKPGDGGFAYGCPQGMMDGDDLIFLPEGAEEDCAVSGFPSELKEGDDFIFLPEEKPEETLEEKPEEKPEETPKDTPEQIPEEKPEEALGETPEESGDAAPDDCSVVIVQPQSGPRVILKICH